MESKENLQTKLQNSDYNNITVKRLYLDVAPCVLPFENDCEMLNKRSRIHEITKQDLNNVVKVNEENGSIKANNVVDKKEDKDEYKELDDFLNKEELELDDDNSEMSFIMDSQFKWSSSIGAMLWIQRQMASGSDPRNILKKMILDDTEIPEDMDTTTLWKVIASIIAEPPRRKRLETVTTFDDVVQLIKKCKNILVLTGAGVSVSCGIPDFRSRDGIYARLTIDYPDLPDPQAMFDIQYFKKNPKPFFKFAKEIYPGQFKPSLSHCFIGELEKAGHLLRNYTQNIDTLEPSAYITKVIQCHGSFAKATCMLCKHKVEASAIREDVMNQVVPRCLLCPGSEEFAILKPDIVFFGESLSDEFHNQIEIDKEHCDLLIVMGSSLKVRPVAIIPNVLPAHVPQILINRESLPHMNFDVELLGDCDVIVKEICHHLGESFLNLCDVNSQKTSMDTEKPTFFENNNIGGDSSSGVIEDKNTEGEEIILKNNIKSISSESKINNSHSFTEKCIENDTSINKNVNKFNINAETNESTYSSDKVIQKATMIDNSLNNINYEELKNGEISTLSPISNVNELKISDENKNCKQLVNLSIIDITLPYNSDINENGINSDIEATDSHQLLTENCLNTAENMNFVKIGFEEKPMDNLLNTLEDNKMVGFNIKENEMECIINHNNEIHGQDSLDSSNQGKDNDMKIDDIHNENISQMKQKNINKTKNLINLEDLLKGQAYTCFVTRKYAFSGAEIYEKDLLADSFAVNTPSSTMSNWSCQDDENDEIYSFLNDDTENSNSNSNDGENQIKNENLDDNIISVKDFVISHHVKNTLKNDDLNLIKEDFPLYSIEDENEAVENIQIDQNVLCNQINFKGSIGQCLVNMEQNIDTNENKLDSLNKCSDKIIIAENETISQEKLKASKI